MKNRLLIAGHYQINHNTITQSNDISLSVDKNVAYLLTTKSMSTIPNLENILEHCKENWVIDGNDKTKKYYLLKPITTLTLNQRQLDSIESVQKLDFNPTPAALNTLEYGLKNLDRFDQVAILVGDLGLPYGISSHLSKLLPEEYKILLGAHKYKEPLLISERQVRNKISDQINRKINSIGKTITAQKMYEHTGFIVGKNVEGQLAIVSPDQKNIFNNALGDLNDIPLGKPSPSCAAKLAGLLAECSKLGYHNIYSIYDAIDDPWIESKNLGGIAIHTWLNPKTPVTNKIITLKDMDLENSNSLSRNNFQFQDRVPYDVLTTHMQRLLNLQIVSNGTGLRVSTQGALCSPSVCR